MNYEPACIKTTENQLMAFRKKFTKDAETFSVNIDGSEPVENLHAKRSELRKMARSIIDEADKEQRKLSIEDKNAFDTCTNLLADIQCAFDVKEERSMATRSLNGITGETSSRSLETWQDVQTGKAIPVLGREHKFSDHIQRTGNSITANNYFAALCGHNVTPEIRASMVEGSDIKGGYMVPEVISSEMIDLLRAKNQVINAGARSIPLPAATTRVCRVVSDPAAQWTPENKQITEDSSMSIGALDFNVHKLTCLVKVSLELIQDSSNAGHVIMECISKAMAAELDRAALYGTGSGMPEGIAINKFISSLTLGTGNGNTLSGYDDILKGCLQIANANAPIPSVGIMNPRTLIGYSMLKDGDGKPLVRPDIISKLQFLDTTKVPVNQTVGTAINCSSIILGSFDQLVIGFRQQLEMLVLRERYSEFGQIAFQVSMRIDTAIYQPNAFCLINGILPNS